MTAREQLQAAKALIDSPEKWASSEIQLRKRHCAVTACARVGAFYGSDARSALTAPLPCTEGLAEFNDTHSHAEVMALFDRAIGGA